MATSDRQWKPLRKQSDVAKKLATTIYITESQNQLLKELNRRSKVPVAEYIREGIDLVLQKYRDQLPGQLELESFLPGPEASAPKRR
ncbi:MAG: ribbon-helix-helix domain-containing protein [Bdellovibrionota bacterium]